MKKRADPPSLESRIIVKNLFSAIPESIREEICEDLLRTENIRIERILSKGQSSPAQGWYDQAEHEWVMVLEGSGIVSFEDGREITLTRGDCIHIPAHVRHRVIWTDPDRVTVWLAVFYNPCSPDPDCVICSRNDPPPDGSSVAM